MNEKVFGTPIICKECGFEDRIRLLKGIKIKSLHCGNCGKFGTMIRNTDYDKQRRREKKETTLR